MRIGNWYLLGRVLEWIIDHPEKYNQTEWSCGTTRCIAGWIVDFAGYKFISSATVVPPYVIVDTTDSGYVEDHVWDMSQEVEWVALDLLKLDPQTDSDEIASMLFAGQATWPDILGAVWSLSQYDEEFLSEKIMDEMRRVGVVAEEVEA